MLHLLFFLLKMSIWLPMMQQKKSTSFIEKDPFKTSEIM